MAVWVLILIPNDPYISVGVVYIVLLMPPTFAHLSYSFSPKNAARQTPCPPPLYRHKILCNSPFLPVNSSVTRNINSLNAILPGLFKPPFSPHTPHDETRSCTPVTKPTTSMAPYFLLKTLLHVRPLNILFHPPNQRVSHGNRQNCSRKKEISTPTSLRLSIPRFPSLRNSTYTQRVRPTPAPSLSPPPPSAASISCQRTTSNCRHNLKIGRKTTTYSTKLLGGCCRSSIVFGRLSILIGVGSACLVWALLAVNYIPRFSLDTQATRH